MSSGSVTLTARVLSACERISFYSSAKQLSSSSLLFRLTFEVIEFGLVGSSQATPRLRFVGSLHAALDFVSNKSRGLRNLACDLALMQTVSCAPLPPFCGPPAAFSSSIMPILFLRFPLFLLHSRDALRTRRLYFTSRLRKKDKVLMSDTISI